jgi:hypothetical protein
MRFFGILGVSAAASCVALFAACGDDKAGPIVNDDISWHLGCASASGCGLYATHIQEQVDQNFKVSCSRTKATGLNITVTDPGFKGDGIDPARPPSSIVLSNSDPASQACNVSVLEKADYNYVSSETFKGSCAAQGGDCVLTGGPQNGWDFVGTLSCPGLMKTATGTAAKYILESGTAPGQPVSIAVDNCS